MPRGWSNPWERFRRHLVALVAVSALCGCADPKAEDNSLAIGALLPFTGVSAASGVNYERAMLLAVEHLNAHAAESGLEFRAAVRDSRSSANGAREGLHLLLDQEAVGLIGPDRVELVNAVRAELAGSEMAHLLPSSMTMAELAGGGAGQVIRMAPTAELVGCSLANLVYGDAHRRMVIFHAQDAYRETFALAVKDSFERFKFASHRGTAYTLPLPTDTSDFAATVGNAMDLNPDLAVIAADAPVAAKLLRVWSTLASKRVRLFFEPSLRSYAFLRNVSPATVDGASGVSLALPSKSREFEAAFDERWSGETPLIESFLYYDAVIAVGLAAIQAQHELGRRPTREDVSNRVLDILRGPGRSVSWRELERAIELIQQGSMIRYVGAAGSSFLDSRGNLDGATAIFDFWRVRDGSIESETFGACPAGTLTQPIP